MPPKNFPNMIKKIIIIKIGPKPNTLQIIWTIRIIKKWLYTLTFKHSEQRMYCYVVYLYIFLYRLLHITAESLKNPSTVQLSFHCQQAVPDRTLLILKNGRILVLRHYYYFLNGQSWAGKRKSISHKSTVKSICHLCPNPIWPYVLSCCIEGQQITGAVLTEYNSYPLTESGETHTAS